VEWTTSGAIKLQDFFYAIGSVHRSDKDGMNLTWTYYKENFGRLKEMLGKASTSLMDALIVYSCGGFCSSEKADEIEKFFLDNPMPQNQRKVLQTVEGMRANAVFLGLLEKSELGDKGFWDSL